VLDNSASLTLGNTIALDADLTVAVGNHLTLGGTISGTGGLSQDGLADLTRAAPTASAAVNILTGSVTTVGTGALGNTSLVNVGAGASLKPGRQQQRGQPGRQW
jgi:hypothetical protein